MENLYPAGPAAVPADLTRPSKAYQHRAWLAMGVLALFVLLYLFLSGWFAWTAWRLFAAAVEGGGDAFLGVIVGACAAFLAVFMLKALFFVKHGSDTKDVEITAQEQPRLFAFLHRLADEAGAPRPHRVFLSARVNAAVFYDLSVLNLILPSRKNLEIGLGLVNVLNIGEFKAVCAHEFGHFAQRSMAVGRWVYIAQQIAGHIIAKRDALDSFLEGLSRVDIRIAWVGWILRLIVWALRSLLDTAFMLVVLAQRSLSREMEMQADLVAVSLTGSDALIHALHRLQVADDAWDRTLGFLNGELASKRAPKDAFAIQSHIITRMGALLNVADYGQEPPRPDGDPAAHRLFKADIAQPPRMWSTHPLNHEREENAKRNYLAAEGDARSAWQLFDEVESVRERVSASLFTAPDLEPAPSEEAITRLDEHFSREHLSRAYRGVYYGRSPVRAAAKPADLYDALEGATAQLDALYPESISTELEQAASLEKEKSLLESLYEGRLKAPGDVIRHRDRSLKKNELPGAIAAVQAELSAVQARISAHDRLCRTAHRAAAAQLGHGWEDYVVGLASVLHYADHNEANLQDAQRSLNNVIALATATRRVSSSDRNRIVAEANSLYNLLDQLFTRSSEVKLDTALLARLEIASWAEGIGELGLLGATGENIGEWLKVVDGWVDHATGILGALRRHALEELLITESKLATWLRAGSTPDAAPAASSVPAAFPVLLPGQERKLKNRLDWWGRFQTADGIVPTLARLGAAGVIVGAVLTLGGAVGSSTITVYNGLDRSVRVDAGGKILQLAAHSFGSTDSPGKGHYTISAHTSEGAEIERFEVDLSSSFATQIYNVASATPLVEWTANYGNVGPIPERPLGAPRWSSSSVDHVFTDPPSQISSKSGGGTRSALSAAPADATPNQMLGILGSDAERSALVKAHARWDGAHTPYLMHWLSLAAQTGEQAQIITARLQDDPAEVIARRFEQDAATDPAAHARVCAAHTALLQATPDNADLHYLATRCIKDKAAKAQAFITAQQKWPKNGWLAYAAAYSHAEHQRWAQAQEAWSIARAADPALASIVSIDMARARRLQSGTQADLGDLARNSPGLRQMLMLEKDSPELEGPTKAYALLAQGKLEEALQRVSKTPAEALLLRLAASSDKASAALVRRALSLPDGEGLDETSLPFTLALALREKADTRAYAETLRRIQPEYADNMLSFLLNAQAGKIAEAEQALVGLDPQVLGQAWGMGVILLGQQAPANWRNGAKRLLFVPERPWFM